MHLQTFLQQLLDKNGADQIVFVRDDASTFEHDRAWKKFVMTPKVRGKVFKREASDSGTFLVSDVIPPSRPCRRSSMDTDVALCGSPRTAAGVSEAETLPPPRPNRKASMDLFVSFEEEWNNSFQTTAAPYRPSRKVSMDHISS